jgi:hypothetical protein
MFGEYMCLTCESPSDYVLKNGQCVLKLAKECSEHQFADGSKCVDSDTLDENCLYANTNLVSYRRRASCTLCTADFGLNKDGSGCSECPENCKRCNDEAECLECHYGFVEDGKNCVECPDGC